MNLRVASKIQNIISLLYHEVDILFSVLEFLIYLFIYLLFSISATRQIIF